VVLSSVLPMANWPASKGIGAPDTIEYPAAGLIIYDELATSEPAINNTTNPEKPHTFTVHSDSTRTVGSTQIVDRGQLRVAVAWSDPPSIAGGAGLLINDLDLELQSPGDDNALDTSDDVFYDGNVYHAGQGVKMGQWSAPRDPAAKITDERNPVEGIHLSADPDGDGDPSDSQLPTGTWRVTVRRGVGGSVPDTGGTCAVVGAETCSDDPTQICSRPAARLATAPVRAGALPRPSASGLSTAPARAWPTPRSPASITTTAPGTTPVSSSTRATRVHATGTRDRSPC
jgi:hypothetical protein